MAAWWQPTAEGYFKHVPKAAVLQAVGEFAPESVNRLAKLKKADIAREAERLVNGKGWMPVISRWMACPSKARRTVRRQSPPWRVNPPKRWPLDPCRRQAPRPKPGRFAARRNSHDPHHHQPPAHGGDLRSPHGARPPLARRWRRARLPPALGLDGPCRPHRHSPHHGPRLAARRVVDHRNQGMTPAPAPAFRAGAGGFKNPGTAVAAPGVESEQPIKNTTPPPSLALRRRR